MREKYINTYNIIYGVFIIISAVIHLITLITDYNYNQYNNES
ncbi:hypothetical protein [Anaerosalibacter massiliensis]|uniref:Uncharacterized protein n=1 Tax=Anaerosalibacter massiliensis TaxID=1347392 RepID=A0A9X2S3Y4_9FIRM|nr:hypothetical protein [Anaerosalibacter massiliensis]MCR2042689.1 hypothetical protein [Anaerosalibacter massiliensis]